MKDVFGEASIGSSYHGMPGRLFTSHVNFETFLPSCHPSSPGFFPRLSFYDIQIRFGDPFHPDQAGP